MKLVREKTSVETVCLAYNYQSSTKVVSISWGEPVDEVLYFGYKSAKKILLSWAVLARRDETRQKRIIEITENVSRNLKPKQFR